MHERVRRLRIVAAAAAVLALAGCTVSAPEPLPTAGGDGIDLDVGPRTSFVDAGPSGVTVADGDDWSLPGWVRPAPNSGYFSEEADASELVAVRSVDLSWRQLRPTAEKRIDRTSAGDAQGMSFDALDAQLRQPGDFWMRIFASGEDWAPAWVAEECGVSSYGTCRSGTSACGATSWTPTGCCSSTWGWPPTRG